MSDNSKQNNIYWLVNGSFCKKGVFENFNGKKVEAKHEVFFVPKQLKVPNSEKQ